MFMDFWEKMIENPLFIRWVFDTNMEIEQYWSDYLTSHPEEADQLTALKEQLRLLRFPAERLTAEEKRELSAAILHRLPIDKRQPYCRRVFLSFFRYAAIALIFFSVGGALVYFLMKNEVIPPAYVNQVLSPAELNEPVLLLPQGRNVGLQSTNPTLDYSRAGQILLNNDSLIRLAVANSIPEINQLVIPYGSRSKVILSDNTVVWLNAGSRLIYPSLFRDKTREVTLFGEAFFDVAENRAIPFIVKTTSVDVKVLGTQFNISAYPEDNVVQTVLKAGSVSLRRHQAGLFEKEIVLKPNQMAAFNKTNNETKVYEVDAGYYTIWTEGLLSFDQVDLNRIIKKVERYYNLRVDYGNPLTGSIKISGKLDLNKEKEEVFEYLAKVSGTKIDKINNGFYIIR